MSQFAQLTSLSASRVEGEMVEVYDWAPDEPSNTGLCASHKRRGTWASADCNERSQFICQLCK